MNGGPSTKSRKSRSREVALGHPHCRRYPADRILGLAEHVTFTEQIILALALIAIVGLILMRKKPPESR